VGNCRQINAPTILNIESPKNLNVMAKIGVLDLVFKPLVR